MNQSDLEKKLMEAFASEADERLDSLFSRLTELENCTDVDRKKKILEVVFREAHSLKGAARSVNLAPIESLCQKMESVFGAIKSAELDFTPGLFDTLHDATKKIETYLAPADTADKKQTEEEMVVLGRLLEETLDRRPSTVPVADETASVAAVDFSDQTPQPSMAAPEPKESDDGAAQIPAPACADTLQDHADPSFQCRPLFSDSVRIPTGKLDSLLLKVEELISVKQIANQYLVRLKEIRDTVIDSKQWDKFLMELAVLKAPDKNRSGDAELMEHLDRIQETSQKRYEKIGALIQSMEQGNRTLGSLMNDLLDDTRRMTLHPFTTLFAILPRMVREIAKDQGKAAELVLSGGEIEIDKRILEGIKDPILHLLRNAVDHGIESPAVRKSRGKPEKGVIRINISQIENNRAELTLSDYGGGIDLSAIKSKALKAGIITEKEMHKLSDTEIVSLIFHSGLSTSPLITEISGRGLGMAIVKDSIDQLGGRISVTTVSGQGSSFVLQIPVTQVTFRGILIQSAGHLFILPNANVMHAVQVRPESIMTVENRSVIRINNQTLSILYLHQVLDLPKPPRPKGRNGASDQPHALPVVIVEKDDNKMAFIVDEILNEQEVLVKNLGKQLGRVPNIAGATVLGSGRVVPVINVNDLIKSASGTAVSSRSVESSPAAEKREKSILIVEDSFTSRTLLKNILEAAGYIVTTAIDGQEGFTRLRSDTFDAVVSDIEMPRMNGFELTQKIRSDKILSEIPVILVTSLDSRKDRERGIEAGADAYIVKSSFDQGNLLAVLERLI